jgi:hypothetical protein
MVIVRLALALSLAFGFAACTAGDCDPLESCDIRERSCQESVAKVIACLRGSRAVAPAVKVVDADDFIDEQVSDADGEPFNDDRRDHYRALHLFRLMPAEIESGQLAFDEWNDVAAFFDPETHGVTVLDRGRAVDDSSSVLLLAHELVHAQQSRETDDAFYEPADDSRDASLAATAMVEGEAIFYQDLAAIYAYGFEPDDVDWARVFGSFKSAAWAQSRVERTIYERSYSVFSYAFGGAYLSEAYRAGGSPAVRKVTRAVPASTLAVTEGYPPEADVPAVESLDDVAIPMLPESFEYLSSTRAGAYLFETFLARTVDEDAYFVPDFLETGVVGDSLSTFRVGADQVSAFWRVRLQTDGQAIALERRIGDKAGFVVKREDRDVMIAAVSDDSLREQIEHDLSWGPAPEPEVDTGEEEMPKARPLRCKLHRLGL